MSKQCLACEAALVPIRIVDQLGQGRVNVGFLYTVETDPKTGAFSGRVKNAAGTVHAWMCEACHRVELYAEPGSD